MIRKLVFLMFLSTIPILGTMQLAPIEIQGPLQEKELKALIIGNTIIGTSSHSQSLYEVYFSPDGTLYFRKNSDLGQVYVGRWWITGNKIHSEWPTYKNSQENILQYYHLYENVYLPYNVNNGCDKKNTFCRPFLVVQGKHSFVDDFLKASLKDEPSPLKNKN